jgi:hypothetical protein
MDIKPTKYKKGDMVRLKKWSTESLGIVMEQDAAIVNVHWIVCPKHIYGLRGRVAVYNLISVEKGD